MRTMYPRLFLALLLLHSATAVVIPPAPQWLTLKGDAPAVIARGGFSGLFPDASQYAYQFAMSNSLKGVVLFCDLQLTKDASGICRTGLKLDNSTIIADVFPKRDKSYNVNGENMHGWFAVDFTTDEILNNVTVIQNVLSRPGIFDGSLGVMLLEDVIGMHPRFVWVNVQYDLFYKQHNLDMQDFVHSVATETKIDYISSPEIGFLKALSGKLTKEKVKLIFRFLNEDVVEPSTNQTYGSLIKDLASIKSFASGILVPKTYIWPVNKDQYLEQSTSLVTDAHRLGLEVYASDFANDLPASYNYSFDPTAEYLQFIDNAQFSVDGVLTDFPSTASETIACFAHNKGNDSLQDGRPLIITRNGASGVFAGSTDLAYQQAVKDGADVIDCSVQLSKDGVAFCLDSADLMGETTAISTFMTRAATIPEIQASSGIFSFDLTWSEIQSLKPQLNSPFAQSGLQRNPAAKNDGKFTTLAEFLDFAKNSSVPGILINIENAPYLASKKGLGIVDTVIAALANASYDKQTTQQVLIQSDDTSVLSAFKQFSTYQRVLYLKNAISDAPQPAVDEIKKFADAVTIPRSSIMDVKGFFIYGSTNVTDQMHKANISVFVSVLRNEFLTVAFDFFSDPIVEIASYTLSIGVDGLVTEYPATATAYFRSKCADPNAKLPFTIVPSDPGALLELAPPEAVPAEKANPPVLQVSDVADPPLPPVAVIAAEAAPPAPAPSNSSSQPSGQAANAVASVSLCLLLAVLASIFLSYH